MRKLNYQDTDPNTRALAGALASKARAGDELTEKFIQVTDNVRLAHYGGQSARFLEIQDASRTVYGFEGADSYGFGFEGEPGNDLQSVALDAADVDKLILALQEMKVYLARQGAVNG